MNTSEKKSVRRRELRADARARKRAEKFASQLKPGETLLLLGHFSGAKALLAWLAVIVALLVANRLLLGRPFAMLFCSILIMFAAYEASRALASAQNSAVLVTDRRIYGVAGDLLFDLRYRDIRSIGVRNDILLDTGDPGTSVRLRFLTNAKEFYNTVMPQFRRYQGRG